jgi:[ribosomal protein S5]-alanine N-acetyltransferase
MLFLVFMSINIIPPTEEFASLFYQWRNESTTQKFNPVKKRSVEELHEMLHSTPRTLNPLDKSAAHRWFIDFDKEIVGTVSLSEINSMMGTAEIGYMIGEAYHGRGIATAAVKLWIQMIFELTDIRKLTASVAEQNIASIRVLEKVGFKKEGLLREHYIVQNLPTNEIIFGLLRREWS